MMFMIILLFLVVKMDKIRYNKWVLKGDLYE